MKLILAVVTAEELVTEKIWPLVFWSAVIIVSGIFIFLYFKARSLASRILVRRMARKLRGRMLPVDDLPVLDSLVSVTRAELNYNYISLWEPGEHLSLSGPDDRAAWLSFFMYPEPGRAFVAIEFYQEGNFLINPYGKWRRVLFYEIRKERNGEYSIYSKAYKSLQDKNAIRRGADILLENITEKKIPPEMLPE